jgi:hypothetical protein
MAIACPGELPTALDVIENALGARPKPEQLRKLTMAQVEDLSGLLADLSDAQSESTIPGGASLVGGFLGAFWGDPSLRDDLGKALLYYENLVVLDPLADFFDDRSSLPVPRAIRFRRTDGQYNTLTMGPDSWSRQNSFAALREDPKEAVGRFANIVSNLYSLDPLIRSGVVVLRSQWPTLARRADSLATSVRHDIRSREMQSLARQPSTAEDAFPVWDNMRGLSMRLNSGTINRSDEPWETQHIFYYLAKTLAIADAAGAQYVPSTERDLQLLRAKANTAVGTVHPAAFLDEVARVVVPSFEVPIARAVEMRKSSENFDDWRSMLNQIRRAGPATDAAELRERVEDGLRPTVHRVEAELTRGSALSLLDKSAADFVFTGGIAGIAAVASGGNPAVAVGAAASAGVITWLRSAYGQKSPTGAEAVMAALVQRTKK